MSLLAFDPTGKLAANKKIETHTISAINGVEYNYIVPDYAPFFRDSLVVVHVDTGAILQEGVDYEIIIEFPAGTDALKSSIYCGFYLTDPNASGSYQVQVQSIGGDFVTPTTQAISDGLNAIYNLQNLTWSDINPSTIPSTFPPSAHTQPLTDVQVLAAVQNSFSDIRVALQNLPSQGLQLSDIIDFDSAALQPLLDGMTNIVAAIQAKNIQNIVQHEAAYLYGSDVNLGAVSTAAWTDIPTLSVTIGTAGTYEIDWDLNPLVAPAGAQLLSRFIIDSGGTQVIVNEAILKGYIRSFAAGDIITLQVRAKDTNTTSILIANAAGTFGASLVAKRLSS